jgi:hypothetical protein
MIHVHFFRNSANKGRRTAPADFPDRKGITLMDVTVAMAFISFTMLALFSLIRGVNRQSMDASSEFLCLQMAREPIEVFRAFSYEWVRDYKDHPLPEFPLVENPVKTEFPVNLFGPQAVWAKVRRPEEVRFLRREIIISREMVTAEGAGVIVTVQVSPVANSRLDTWLSRETVSVQALFVGKKP